jgi:hypothetical protein
MIKWVLIGGGMVAGVAFAAGTYVGWKTTLKVIDSVKAKKEKEDVRR